MNHSQLGMCFFSIFLICLRRHLGRENFYLLLKFFVDFHTTTRCVISVVVLLFTQFTHADCTARRMKQNFIFMQRMSDLPLGLQISLDRSVMRCRLQLCSHHFCVIPIECKHYAPQISISVSPFSIFKMRIVNSYFSISYLVISKI